MERQYFPETVLGQGSMGTQRISFVTNIIPADK